MSAAYFEVPDISKAIYFQMKSIDIMKDLGIKKQDPIMKEGLRILEFYQNLQSSKKVKENHEKEKKKIMEHQLYSGFQLMRLQENNFSNRMPKFTDHMMGGGLGYGGVSMHPKKR